MSVRILPLRRVLISACWPYSGRKYEVWERGRCVHRTDDLNEANEKASET